MIPVEAEDIPLVKANSSSAATSTNTELNGMPHAHQTRGCRRYTSSRTVHSAEHWRAPPLTAPHDAVSARGNDRAGMHHLTDVLGGLALGSIWLAW